MTKRELDGLRLVAGGKIEGGMAGALGIAEARAQGHLARIIAKLGASNRAETVMIAIRLGWIGLDEVAERA